MTRATLVRLAGLAAGVAIVASCDTTAPGSDPCPPSGVELVTTGSSSTARAPPASPTIVDRLADRRHVDQRRLTRCSCASTCIAARV